MSSENKKIALEAVANNWGRSKTQCPRSSFSNKVTKESTWRNPQKKLKEAINAQDNLQTSIHSTRKSIKRKADGSPAVALVSSVGNVEKLSTEIKPTFKEYKSQFKTSANEASNQSKIEGGQLSTISRNSGSTSTCTQAKGKISLQARLDNIREQNKLIVNRSLGLYASHNKGYTLNDDNYKGGNQGRGVRQDPLPGVRQNTMPGVRQNTMPGVRQNTMPGVRQNTLPEVRQNTLPASKSVTPKDSSCSKYPELAPSNAPRSKIRDLIIKNVRKDKNFQKRLNNLSKGNDGHMMVNAEILNKTSSGILNKKSTETLRANPSETLRNTSTRIFNKPSSRNLNKPATQVLNKPSTQVLNKPSTQILNKPSTQILNTNYSDTFDQSSANAMSEVEEMDWEPSDQEIMIEHIKSIRKSIGTQVEPSHAIPVFCGQYESSPYNKLILVYDTNIFVSCLPFIEKLRDTFISDLGLPFIYVPWRVIQELDKLKSTKKKQLRTCAIKAINYLNDNFTVRHPRMCGQSFEEFCIMTGGSSSLPDDQILQVCLNVRKTAGCRNLVFITNDRNLETKAMMSGIEAFSKDRFSEELLSANSGQSGFFKGVPHMSSSMKKKNDLLYCKLKDILKELFNRLVEVEMKLAFKEGWEDVLRKKPPWSLSDAIQCLIVHWRSVFTFLFKKNVFIFAEELQKHFKRADSGDASLIFEIIRIFREMLASIKSSQTSDKGYGKLLERAISDVEALSHAENEEEEEEEAKKMRVEEAIPPPPVPSPSFVPCEPPQIINYEPPSFPEQVCKEKIKRLLNIIWDQIRTFGSTVSEIVTGNAAGVSSNPEAFSEMCNRVPHVMRSMHELAGIVEKVLLSGLDEIAHHSQIIVYFSSFLLSLNLIQSDSSDVQLLPMYLTVFCRDAEGRNDLSLFLNGVKQFAAEIMHRMNSIGFV